MYRSAICLILLLLVGTTAAKVPVFQSAQSRFATVAHGSPDNLVVWCHGETQDLWAARVRSDLFVEQPPTPIIGSSTVYPKCYDVEGDGLDFMVAWVGNESGNGYLWCSPVDQGGIQHGTFTVAAGATLYAIERPVIAYRSASTYRGRCYMFLWMEYRNGAYGLYAARFVPDGPVQLPDPGGFLVTGLPANQTPWTYGITSDGDRFLVVWNDMTAGSKKVAGLLLDASDIHGVTALPPISSVGTIPMSFPVAAYDPATQVYQVVWRIAVGTETVVLSRTLDVAGLPIGPQFQLEPDPELNDWQNIASGGNNFVAVWDQTTPGPQRPQARWRGVANRSCATEANFVCYQPESQRYADVAASGDQYMVVWEEPDGAYPGIYADTVSFWQRHFYSLTQEATATNSGRHIVLDPVTRWLHMVYAVNIGQNSAICYTHSTDGGEHWWPIEVVGEGYYPTIACEGQGGLVWVSYFKPLEDNQVGLRTAARTAPQQWQTWALDDWVADPTEVCSPSMAMPHAGPNSIPMVYVAYRKLVGSNDSILLRSVSLLGGSSDPEEVWSSTTYPLRDPSMALTPDHIVHVVWRSGSQYPVVNYRQRVAGLWGAMEEVTAAGPPGCKPAYCTSAEAYGNRVYAVWRSGLAVTGEIWSASRLVTGQNWELWSNLSGTPTPSNNPQQSTPWAFAWQDPMLALYDDIWGQVFGVSVPIALDQYRSYLPSIAAEWSAPGEPPRLRLYTVWTSETPTGAPYPYEVLFKRQDFSPPMDGNRDFTYYDCEVGDSVKSPYCLTRDGFARWRDYRVDFGHKTLRYRLPFLNPNYDYKLRAVLFQASRDTWQQAFVSDSVPLASVRLRPLVPETVWIDIPRELYMKDCEVTLDINKLAGEYAAVAELRLYECFPARQKGGGGDGGELVVVSRSVIRLSQPAPSLFRDATSLTYAVAEPRNVAVNVYDVQGRLMRRLTSGLCERGTHDVRWNGLDDVGRRVPAGAYVMRVESEGVSQTRKVVLTR